MEATQTTLRRKAVIYIRVSDPSQIDNNSLETQAKTCQAFAENNGYDIVEIFRDKGISAKHVNTRPEMRRLLEYCTIKKNKISSVIVYKMDRWTRNVEEGLVAISLLAKYGISVLPATEITEQNPMGKAMRTILMALGELDNNLKGERVKDNMQTMFRNGLWPWKPHIGYKRPFTTREQNKGKPPILDKKLSKMLRTMFIEASKLPTSKKNLAKYLNSLGFEQVYGRPATGKLITHIISDTFYYGYMYAPKWKEYAEGLHTALIDKNTWERAYMNVFQSKRKYKTQDSKLYPLKETLRCSSCLKVMTSSNPKGRNKHYYYYECHEKTCKVNERIDVEEAHNEFLSLLSSIRPTERVLKLFNQLVFDEWNESIEHRRKEAEILDVQIQSLENKITSISEGNAKGILTDDEAKTRAEEARKDIAILRIERSDIRIEQYNTESIKNFTSNFLLNVDKLWLNMELTQQQALQKEIFPEGLLVKNHKIRTVGMARSFELIQAMENPNFNLVTRLGFEPRTKSLKGSCSTAELSGRTIKKLANFETSTNNYTNKAVY